LLNMIEAGGRMWYSNHHIPPRVGVGDLSWGDVSTQSFGGEWPGGDHACHQNGLEVDFRYVRSDGQEIPLNIAGPDSLYYSNTETAALMTYLLANETVIVIYIDTAHAYLTDDGAGILQHWPGHSDHFHVRIEDPDGTSN